MSVLPCFTSHYALPSQGSLLTLEEPGKSKAGGPVSVFDLAQQAGLKDVVLVDDRIDGAIQGWRNAQKAKVKLCYGLKLVVCADGDLKDEASIGTQSKVIVFAREGEPNAQGLPKGYADLVSIWSRASTRGFYHSARTSWPWLKEQWSPRLLLALPWASSFIAKNTLTFNRIVPDLPCAPWVFSEVKSDLPFAPLIDAAIGRYVKENPAAQVQNMHAVYYAKASDYPAYVTMRAKGAQGTYAAPGVDHLASDSFGFDTFLSLCPPPTPPPPASP